jgi:hypothetical protein
MIGDGDDEFSMKKGIRDILKQESKGFICGSCNHIIGKASQKTSGTNHRDHCPLCLSSFHVDDKIPGDRASKCKAVMTPIGMTFKSINKEPMVVYECSGCGKIHKNRCAADDNDFTIAQVIEKSIKRLKSHDREKYFLRLQSAHIDLITESDDIEALLISRFGEKHIPSEFIKMFNLDIKNQ